MDAATVTPRAPKPAPALAPERGRRLRVPRMRPAVAGRRTWVYPAAVGALLVVTLLLRLWGIKQGLPYSYNADEATHFVPRAVAFLSQDLNPHYFLNPPAYSYLLYDRVRAVVRERGRGSHRVHVRPDGGVRGRPRGRRGARDGGGVADVPGRRAAVRPAGGPARRRDLGVRVPAGLLQPPGAQRRPHAGAGGAVAVRDRGRAAPRPHARLRDRGHRHRARRGATKYTGGIMLVCLLAAAVCDGAARVREGGAARRLRLALALALLSFLLANPYAAARFIVVPLRRLPAGVAGRGHGAGEAREQSRQRDRLLPVDVHVGTRMGPGAGGGRRRGAAAGAAAARDGARAAAGADRVHHLHGRSAALLRPLADADLPDRRGARGVRRGRAGTVAVASARRSARPAGGAGVARRRDRRRAAARPERRRRHPQRRRAVASRHAQPHAGVDGPPHPGRVEGGDRAGRTRQLGDGRRPRGARDADGRALVAVPDLADESRPEPASCFRPASTGTCTSTSTSGR